MTLLFENKPKSKEEEQTQIQLCLKVLQVFLIAAKLRLQQDTWEASSVTLCPQ